jgi:hypothetical protein
MRTVTLLMTVAVMLAAGGAVDAEDAAALPAGTLRVGAGTAVGFVREGWDGDGKKADRPDAVIIGARIGVACGFTDRAGAVFDWSPGVTDTDLTGIDLGNDGNGPREIYEGLGDFRLKGQFQIIGNGTPLPSGRFRMRVAPGIVIPFPGIDDGDALGSHAWGAGGAVSFDTLVSDAFFFNTAGEAYWFPVNNKSGTNNRWEFSLEAGPRWTVALGAARFAFALPVYWTAAGGNGNEGKGGIATHALALRPSLALHITRPFRINLEIEYACPLYGKNSSIVHSITVKAPVDFNFAKNKGKEGEGE